MKRILYIFLSVLLLSACADDRSAKNLFERVESIMEDAPDSALAILDSAENGVGEYGKADRMRYQLLKAEAMNKSFVDFTTDSVMLEVARYYDRHGSSNEKMKAHYLLGCAYRDMGDSPMALSCYKDATEKADTSSADCDYLQLAKICGQMAYLYHSQSSPDYEIAYERRAMEYSMLAKDTLLSNTYYFHLSEAYYLLGQSDSVLSICNNAKRKYEDMGYKDKAAGCLPLIIDVFLNRGDYYKAKNAIDEFEAYSNLFDENKDIRAGYEIYYHSKGRYYEGVNMLDSAIIYYSKLLSIDDLNCNEAGYKGLMSISKKQGEYERTAEYAIQYCHFNDSSLVVHSSEEINRMHAIYNYNNMLVKKRSAEKKLHDFTISVIALVALITIMVYVLISRYKSNIREEKAKQISQNREYNGLLDRFNVMSSELELLRENADKLREEKEMEIFNLQKSLSLYYEDPSVISTWNQERNLYTSAIVKHLHKLASRGQAVTYSELKSINEAVGNSIPGFVEFINKETARLTDREKSICILIRMRFIPSEIATLLDLSLQAVTNIKAKINKKLFRSEGAKSLNVHIMGIK